jgi:hypothetical protein
MLQKQREQQQAEGAAVQPVHQQPAAVTTQFTNVQPAQPFPPQVPQVPQEVPHQHVSQEPVTVQKGQRPVPPPHQQVSTVQHQQQQAPSTKRQKTATSSGGSRKAIPATSAHSGASQPQLYPPQVQLQQQVQPNVTSSQTTAQMAPPSVESVVQKSNSVHENGSATQQGFVYTQPTTTASVALAPITATVVSAPRVGPQLVNGQVIMPKHEVSNIFCRIFFCESSSDV